MAEPTVPRLILASGSRTRRVMMEGAGVACDVVPSQVDEAALKAELEAELSIGPDYAPTVARVLASEKAREVSDRHPGALVIGADQTLEVQLTRAGVDASWMLDKPGSVAEARQHLQMMRGRVHTLHSAVSLVRDGEEAWSTVTSARMTMRDFSDAFLDDYLARTGDAVLTSVGCYQLEGLGAQLFDRIEGDYFTVLGMPLLPLLGALRQAGVITG